MTVSGIVFLIVENCNGIHPTIHARNISSLTSIFSRLPFTTQLFPRSLYRCCPCSSLSQLGWLEEPLDFCLQSHFNPNESSTILFKWAFSNTFGLCFHMVCNSVCFLMGSCIGQSTNSILWQTFFILCSHRHLTPGKQTWWDFPK